MAEENTPLTALEKFKLAALSPEITDQQVEEMFLNLSVTSEEEIGEAFDILSKYRPAILQKYKLI